MHPRTCDRRMATTVTFLSQLVSDSEPRYSTAVSTVVRFTSMTCRMVGCKFQAHSDEIAFDGYCCRRCRDDGGRNHGRQPSCNIKTISIYIYDSKSQRSRPKTFWWKCGNFGAPHGRRLGTILASQARPVILECRRESYPKP